MSTESSVYIRYIEHEHVWILISAISFCRVRFCSKKEKEHLLMLMLCSSDPTCRANANRTVVWHSTSMKFFVSSFPTRQLVHFRMSIFAQVLAILSFIWSPTHCVNLYKCPLLDRCAVSGWWRLLCQARALSIHYG